MTPDSFSDFVASLTEGDADIAELRANVRSGKTVNKAKQVRANARHFSAAFQDRPRMTVNAKILAFEEQNPGLLQFLGEAGDWSDFARSLEAQIRSKGTLSDRQIAAARSMQAKVAARDEAKATPVSKPATVAGFAPVTAVIQHILDSGNQYPKIGLKTDAGVDVIVRWSPKHQSVTLLRDGAFAGSIRGDEWAPSEAVRGLDKPAKADLWALLQAFCADPEATLARIGKELGTCMICSRALSDPESVARGIGPVCAKKAGF